MDMSEPSEGRFRGVLSIDGPASTEIKFDDLKRFLIYLHRARKKDFIKGISGVYSYDMGNQERSIDISEAAGFIYKESY